MTEVLLTVLAGAAFVWVVVGAKSPVKMCICGHDRIRHTHLHARTYCGTCGPRVCEHFMRDWWWYRFFRGES